MKIVLTFVGYLFTTVLLFLSCSKNKDQPTPIIPPPLAVNQPPVARAGADTTFTLSHCVAVFSFPLDGSKSSDPENKITAASWRVISGPVGIDLFYTPNSLNATATLSQAGVYNIELKIVNNHNLTSEDTVTITVIGFSPKEYDLDIISNTTYRFRDNYEDCNVDGPIGGCPFYDETEILGTGTFAPIGLLNIGVKEFSDTENLSYGKLSYFSVYNDTYAIYGNTAINFKKLIQQGGGAFTGNFIITDGSAKLCGENIYKTLGSLMVTGNLDTATKKVSIRIEGKVFF